MPGEIVSLQVGQCGNEIGHEFWKRICEEHGIGVDGEATSERMVDDNCSTFFSSDDNGRYIPRAVLIDLEPRVINSITNGEYDRLYNAERVYECSDGGGAGNNWAVGFCSADKEQNEIGDTVMNMIRDELELCERCDSFSLFHSIAGGTGSGLGSWILEHISDYFGTKLSLHTFSVFPGEKSDVVVQPYNAVFTLSRLIEHSDLTFVLENETITQTAMKKMRIANPSMQDINSIIGRVMAGITAPIRFGSPVFGSFSGIATQLNPVHPLHFVQCGVAPMVPIGSKYPQRTQPNDLMQILSKPESIMTNPFQKFSPGPTDCLLSGLAIFQGSVTAQEVANATYMTNLSQPYGAPLLPLSDIQYCTTYPQAKNRAAVLAVNHSNFAKTVEVIEKQYSAMYKSKAYLKAFEKEEYFAGKPERFVEAHEKVKELIAAYSEPWQYCSARRGEDDD